MKMTPKRFNALKYSAGESELVPTYSVARFLELIGLIVFQGNLYRNFTRIYESSKDRAWRLTQKGEVVLNDYKKEFSNET